MDFLIDKTDFNSALRQILQGRKKNSEETVDITADRSVAKFVVTGRSTAVPIQTEIQGSASVPVGVIAQVKRIADSYADEKLRIRIGEGKFRLQNTSISNPLISMRKIVSRIIDLPIDATPMDFLCLPLIFGVDEIEDCGLHGEAIDAREKLTDALHGAYLSLQPYGFETEDLRSIAESKIRSHAEATRRVLFTRE